MAISTQTSEKKTRSPKKNFQQSQGRRLLLHMHVLLHMHLVPHMHLELHMHVLLRMHLLLHMHLLLIFYSMYMCVQEEEQMGVNQHVRDAVKKSDVYTQNVAEGPPIPRVEFEHLWRTTNGFDAEYAHPSACTLIKTLYRSCVQYFQRRQLTRHAGPCLLRQTVCIVLCFKRVCRSLMRTRMSAGTIDALQPVGEALSLGYRRLHCNAHALQCMNQNKLYMQIGLCRPGCFIVGSGVQAPAAAGHLWQLLYRCFIVSSGVQAPAAGGHLRQGVPRGRRRLRAGSACARSLLRQAHRCGADGAPQSRVARGASQRGRAQGCVPGARRAAAGAACRGQYAVLRAAGVPADRGTAAVVALRRLGAPGA